MIALSQRLTFNVHLTIEKTIMAENVNWNRIYTSLSQSQLPDALSLKECVAGQLNLYAHFDQNDLHTELWHQKLFS
jgi:hypothetical protein